MHNDDKREWSDEKICKNSDRRTIRKAKQLETQDKEQDFSAKKFSELFVIFNLTEEKLHHHTWCSDNNIQKLILKFPLKH